MALPSLKNESSIWNKANNCAVTKSYASINVHSNKERSNSKISIVINTTTSLTSKSRDHQSTILNNEKYCAVTFAIIKYQGQSHQSTNNT